MFPALGHPGTPEVETSAFAGMFLNGNDSPGAH
jgi:hypothetical protein